MPRTNEQNDRQQNRFEKEYTESYGICKSFTCANESKRIDWSVVVMAGKNTADIGFEKQIWDAACVLRATWMRQNIKM